MSKPKPRCRCLVSAPIRSVVANTLDLKQSTTGFNWSKPRLSAVDSFGQGGRINPLSQRYQTARPQMRNKSAMQYLKDSLNHSSTADLRKSNPRASPQRDVTNVLDIPGVASHILGRSRSIPKNEFHKPEITVPLRVGADAT